LDGALPVASNFIKAYREAIVRAMTDTTQTRTWNLFIDVIAQAGRFPTNATSTDAEKFVVNGEERLWLSTAIDRYTGKVVEQQPEYVDE